MCTWFGSSPVVVDCKELGCLIDVCLVDVCLCVEGIGGGCGFSLFGFPVTRLFNAKLKYTANFFVVKMKKIFLPLILILYFLYVWMERGATEVFCSLPRWILPQLTFLFLFWILVFVWASFNFHKKSIFAELNFSRKASFMDAVAEMK